MFLGLHIGHDRAISVAKGGKIVFHTAVERLDRRKYSDSFALPCTEIDQVLGYLNLKIRDVLGVCVSYHGVDASRIEATLRDEFMAYFPDFGGRFSTLDHHLAHALSTKSCSGFEDATVAIVADGAGDQRLWGTQSESVFRVGDDSFYLLDERLQARPFTLVARPEFYDPSFFRPEDDERQISLGLKYEQITYLCGFGPGQVGQTMALAAYGKPLFDVQHLVPRDLDFSLRYPDFLREFERLAAAEGKSLQAFARSRRADVAATYQKFLEEALSRVVKAVTDAFPSKTLCFAGGLFLNCLANRRIRDEHPDKRIFFLSACNDEGQSLGAVAYAQWQDGRGLPTVDGAFPYLGRAFSMDECRAALAGAQLEHVELGDEQLAARLADLIADGAIVGVLRGRSETGPRALGHRSILADPRSIASKVRLDEGIKRRAEFRPYAPIMLEAVARKYTDLVGPAPHMLVAAQVRPEFRELLPAIVHVDGSTRPQTVGDGDDAFLKALLTCFGDRTGVAVLLNTSFNDEVEPIVDSPDDAVRIFQTTDLDALVLENCLHVRPGRWHSLAD